MQFLVVLMAAVRAALRWPKARSLAKISQEHVAGCRLPVPLMTMSPEWRHAHASTNVDVQEFAVVPMGSLILIRLFVLGPNSHHALKKTLGEKGLLGGIGDEGVSHHLFRKMRMA